MNDFVALRRLNQDEWDRIVNDDLWPSDFDKYETLLRMGKSLPQFHYMFSSEHLPHIIDLALERPGIPVGDLAWLWNLELSDAVVLSKQAMREAGVEINLYQLEHT